MCHRDRGEGLKVELSIVSIRLLETFPSNAMILFYFWVLRNFCEESPVIILDIIGSCIVEAVFFLRFISALPLCSIPH